MDFKLVESILSLPYVFFFLLSWIVASAARPFLIFTLISLASNPKAAIRKFQLFVLTVLYLLLNNDKGWKKPKEDPASFFDGKNGSDVKQKTLVFVRHGESTWNDTFNKGDRSTLNFLLYFLPNLFKSIVLEFYFWVTGQSNESWFYDSPISEKGKAQSESIRQFLNTDITYSTPKEAKLIRMLRGDVASSSQLVSSNLRRAIATMAIGFQERIFKNESDGDKILILPALQEISRNPDALCITPPKGQVVPAWTDPKVLNRIYANSIDTSMHTGNKKLTSNGLLRMEEFCNIVFNDIDKENVIVAGHSGWFRAFFRTYLPKTFDHVSKKKKVVNAGTIAFTLKRVETERGPKHLIEPGSMVTLKGGF